MPERGRTLDGEALLKRLPSVRGKMAPHESLANQTWFRVGGPAEVLFRPADQEDLVDFLSACPEDIPLTTIGVASNLLVRDGGVPGVVIRLGSNFASITTNGDIVTSGAAALDRNVALAAENAGLTGLEFLTGIPGTIGGGLRMNAGAYAREFKEIVDTVTLLTRRGEIQTIAVNEMGFSYRMSKAPADVIFVAATLKGESGDRAAIKEKMKKIMEARASTQPIREKTGGSTFANPDHDPEKRKSWQLIEAAGCRGLQIGGAQMSPMHCNFLINTGTATAADIEALGEEVRRRVEAATGVELRWEIKRIGIAA